VKSPALLGAALLAAVLTAPTASATTTLADPAPTNVQITWKDSTLKYIHITWDEETPQPNVIFVRAPGAEKRYRVSYVAADAPNEFDLRAEFLYQFASAVAGSEKEIGVAAGTAEGDTSPVAVSAKFDTIVPRPAVLESFAMSGTSGLTVKWSTPSATDTTPNDPLDQPTTVLSRPQYTRGDGVRIELAKPSAATEFSFTGPPETYTFSVSATNEWLTTAAGATVRTVQSQMKVKIPTWNVYGTDTTITGTVVSTAPQHRTLVLQARNSTTSPWYTVKNSWTKGEIWVDIAPGSGTRQYRLWVANYAENGDAYFGGYSAPVTMTVQQKAIATPQWSGRVNLGWTIPLFVDVQPLVNGKAVLQRWNGKAWTTVGNVAVKNGYGTGYVKATALGRVAFRYYVPAHTWRGLPVAATYSQQFVVTTIP
jgi:hypothetical protein